MIKKLIYTLLYVQFVVVVILATFILGILLLFLALFTPADKRRWLRITIPPLWAKIICFFTFSRIRKFDFHKLPSETCLFISNHRSSIDIPVALGHYPTDFLYMAKTAVFSYPILGQVIKVIGFISVERGSSVKSGRAATNAIKSVLAKKNVLIYPEGTRNTTKKSILPFKQGFTLIAQKTNAPIVPILVTGTDKVYSSERKSMVIPHPINIKVLDPITTKEKNLYPFEKDSPEVVQKKIKKIHEIVSKEYERLETM